MAASSRVWGLLAIQQALDLRGGPLGGLWSQLRGQLLPGDPGLDHAHVQLGCPRQPAVTASGGELSHRLGHQGGQRGVRGADGSGLSRLDRLTATALVAILQAGVADPEIRDPFLTSLAVAGVDGTLRNRMERRPARSRVIARLRERITAFRLHGGEPTFVLELRPIQDRAGLTGGSVTLA